MTWFRFFAELPEDEPLMVHQQELAYAVMAQIETAVEQRRNALKAAIPELKSLKNRTLYVGDEAHFPKGCISCLLGTGLSAIRKTNRCNACCKFCYDYGVLDAIPPIGEGLWEIGGTKFYESATCRYCSPRLQSPRASLMYTWSPLWRLRCTTA